MSPFAFRSWHLSGWHRCDAVMALLLTTWRCCVPGDPEWAAGRSERQPFQVEGDDRSWPPDVPPRL
jgi:hypothetical protein